MAQLLQPETETTDPRILRSRRMLMEALARLLIRKEFEDVSVQEIADEATLNRATFYLHYADKNALLHAMTESRFRDLIQRRAITFTDCNGALRAIALGVCDYLAESTGCPTQLSRMALEGSIIPIVGICSRKGLPIMEWLPVRTRHFPRPPLPGPFLEPHAAGSRLPIASPRKRWQPGLKPW
jgi:AcrR family transcriptional regulator